MQGSLSEFRLAEILQLVAVQQKTGLLRLTQGNKLVTFYFDQGLMVATRDRRHAAYDPLLEFLARVGWLHQDTAAFLKTRLESSREDLGDILLGERYLTEDDLHAILADLAQELVHTTFTWREGTYQFITGDEAIEGLRFRIRQKIDSILMEGARRADEWPRLLERLPGPDVVIDLASAPAADFGPRPQALLAGIQGAMRLGDLVRTGRVPEYEVYEIVVQAVDAGIVRILEMPAPVRPAHSEDAPVFTPRQTATVSMWSLPRPVAWVVAIGVSVVSLGATAFLLPRVTDPHHAAAAEQLAMESARESIRREIEIYRALHGRYPATLTALTVDDLASSELLRRAGPLHYAVAETGRSFELSDAVGAIPAH